MSTKIICFAVFFVFVNSLAAWAQEFELTMPADVDPSLKPRRQLNRAVDRVKKKQTPKEKSPETVLAEFELYLFGNTSDSLSVERRLERLETQLYGKASNESLKSRLRKISGTVHNGYLLKPNVQEKLSKPKNKTRSRWWFPFKKKTNFSKLDKKKKKLLRLAKRQYSKGFWDKALSYYTQLLDMEPNQPEWIFKTAQCRYKIIVSPDCKWSKGDLQSKLIDTRARLVLARVAFLKRGNTIRVDETEKLVAKIDQFRLKQDDQLGNF